MTIYLDGTNFILMTMLRFSRDHRDKRSIIQRYNIIMEAMYGLESDAYKIKVNSSKKSVYQFSWEETLYAMYKEEQENRYKHTKELAKKFEHMAPSKAVDKIDVLVEKYNIAKISNKTDTDWRRFAYKAQVAREARGNDQKDRDDLVEELKSFFGPLWDIDFDDDEDGYEYYY